MEHFHLMNLDQRLIKAVSDLSWESPTDVQQAVIPYVLERKNINVQARTGSGKTAAFAIPLIHILLEEKIFKRNQATLALILAPTKELCNQILKCVISLSKYALKDINCIDVSQNTDADSLKVLLAEQPDIVIGTPFRILDHLHRKHIQLKNLSFLIIDEADLIFTFGYEKDMGELRKYLPQTNLQVILMSATLDDTTKSLRRSFKVGEWIRVELPDESILPTQDKLTQYIISAEENTKYTIIIAMIRLKLIRGKSLIFCNSVDRCYKLKLFLEEFGVRSVVVNSELPVASRIHAIQQFNQGLYDLLLATDEANSQTNPKNKKRSSAHDSEYGVSRGIDFLFVSNVLNFDFPQTPKQYIHRVGRVARANQRGTALSFVSTMDEDRLGEVSKSLSGSTSDDQHVVSSVFKPFQFRMSEVDGFRYRSLDVVGRISRKRIREARFKEIKQEILNSHKLKGYFEDHIADQDALRHDKTISSNSQAHLKDIPDYMVPVSLRALVENSQRRSGYSCRRNQRQESAPLAYPSTLSARPTSSGRLLRPRSHNVRMAIARNPAKAAQLKRRVARKRKAADPLYSLGKRRKAMARI